jgi:hypothetical protein
LFILFVYHLFSDTVSNSDYTERNDWSAMNKELERMRKEVAIAQFKALRRNQFEGTGKK